MYAFFIIDTVLFSILSIFTAYNLFYAFASFFPRKEKIKKQCKETKFHKFAVIFAAYKEDYIIVSSIKEFLKQDYPRECFDVIVVSDNMFNATNTELSKLPINLMVVDLEESLKANSLKFAFKRLNNYDKVIIMDADNIAETNFLSEINKICDNYSAIQLHRTTKNTNSSIAIWDGISEEVNNTIYRRGHVRAGLSSALIGSGMVFDFDWIKKNIEKCTTFAEDKELEILLAQDGVFINYEESICIYDEKVTKKEVFVRQRARWGHAQYICFILILKAIKSGKCNITSIDKMFQWIPISRQFRLILLFLLAITLCVFGSAIALKWWILFVLEVVTIALAIPRKMYNGMLFKSLLKLPYLLLISVKSHFVSFIRIIRKDMNFNHTVKSHTIKKD